jgi:hypothetical protein
MEGVVVKVCLIEPCKRLAIKGNGICDLSAGGFCGHKANLHSFFSLRTIRVVIRESLTKGEFLLDCPQAQFSLSAVIQRSTEGLPPSVVCVLQTKALSV